MDSIQEDSLATYQNRAAASSNCLYGKLRRRVHFTRKSHQHLSLHTTPPKPNDERLQQATGGGGDSSETFLYLAYGSNLSVETFRGRRGIKPLAQINVQVPELKLTFDLPGVPYSEPCFANTARRDPEKDTPEIIRHLDCQDTTKDGYHKDQWHKGLVGVVYEVTAEDYAHIIATEGGGASYNDVLVDCYPFASSDPTTPVPQIPTTHSFKAHTLFAPARQPGEQPPTDGGRLQRPDAAYAQASARYLKLITDGAFEQQLPYEYQDYLKNLRPYTITSNKQRVGQFIFLSLWYPLILTILQLSALFSDKDGRSPVWLTILSGALFQACWASYDAYFKDIFGDGERTVPAGRDADIDTVSTKSKSTSMWEITLNEKEDSFVGDHVSRTL